MSDKQFEKFNLQDQSEVSTSDSTTPTLEPKQDLTDEQIENVLYENLRVHNQQRPGKKYKLVEITDNPFTESDFPKEDNQDWKERFTSWFSNRLSEENTGEVNLTIIGYFDKYVIQPLQSQNEALQKEVEERNDKIFELIQKNNIQEKENAELKSENERLVGLIENAHIIGWIECPGEYDLPKTREQSWQQFANRNNLNP